MSYYITCPDCKANLDPGEKCDCTITSEFEPTYLTAKEVADRWKVSSDLVYSILNHGELRGLRIGGRTWRIPVKEVERYEIKLFSESLPMVGKRKRRNKHREIITRL